MSDAIEFGAPDDDEAVDITMLDGIRDDFKRENEQDEDKVWAHFVQERPDYEVVYSSFVEYDDLIKMQRRCMQGRRLNELAFSKLVLAEQNVAIKRRGSTITHEGENVTFKNTTFQQVIDSVSPTDAVSTLYGRMDGHIIAAATALLQAAGYGDEVMGGNPTQTS